MSRWRWDPQGELFSPMLSLEEIARLPRIAFACAECGELVAHQELEPAPAGGYRYRVRCHGAEEIHDVDGDLAQLVRGLGGSAEEVLPAFRERRVGEPLVELIDLAAYAGGE